MSKEGVDSGNAKGLVPSRFERKREPILLRAEGESERECEGRKVMLVKMERMKVKSFGAPIERL